MADFYNPILKRNIDPIREVLITAGSSNALDLTARAYINPGDEVIVFEPFCFDYKNIIRVAGGKMVAVPLRVKKGGSGQSSNDYTFDKRELKNKISRRTKMILLSNPNNPTGKV